MTIECVIQINSEVPKVFAVFTDLKNAQKNIKSITKIKILTKPDFQVGTKWYETRIMFGKEAIEEMWVSKLSKNKSYQVSAVSHGIDYTTTFNFLPKYKGTEVTMIFTGKPVGWGAKLMSPTFWFFKNQNKRC
ncbi:SRPBCC family protein [Candidatus Gracilibacteria bacterium]|nr:SRPBCC family protein [Candidatus Gracilibacteria bacterium]